MKKNDLILLLLLTCLILLLDQASKVFLLQNGVLPQITGVKFSLVKNHGLIGGTFSKLPPKILQISISSIGLLVVCLYFALQYFLSQRLIMFRVGLTMAFAGILGNLIDKIFRGFVVDFINLSFYPKFYFNVADIFQWPGFFIVLFYILFKNNSFWPDKDQRGKVWIDSYQKHFLKVFLMTHFGLSLLIWSGGFTYLRVILEQAKVSQEFAYNILLNFSLVCLFLFISFSLFLAWFSGLESHRIIGPIYAFRRFIRDFLEDPGSTRKLKLRKKDHLKELEEISEELIDANIIPPLPKE